MATSQATGDRRTLGLGACVALVLGNIVGVGIFLTPAEVARASTGAASYFGFWLLGALVAVAGAMAMAELGTMFPRAGGDYVFLDRAFGRPMASSWGGMSIFATFSGSIAALAVGAVETLRSASFGAAFAVPVATLGDIAINTGDLLAVGLVWAATLANMRSVALVGGLGVLLTWIPIALYGVVGLVCLGWAGLGAAPPIGSSGTLGASQLVDGSFVGAFSAVFFTYAGWNVLTYFGGDIKKPERNIPRGIVYGLGCTLALYLVLNLAFYTLIPLEVLATERNTGVLLANGFFGQTGGDVLAIVMVLLILAGLNVTVMAGSRIVVAMGRNGYISSKLSDVDDDHGTPMTALSLQAAWCTLLVLTGSFSLLVTATGSVMILLSLFTVGAVLVLRRRGYDAPYRCPLYPWIPLFYILTGAWVLAMGALEDAGYLYAGCGAFLALFLFHLMVAKLSPAPTPPQASTPRPDPA